MANEPAIAPVERVDSLILTVRDQRAMLDSDLARIYGVTTKQLNQQFRRNQKKFPKDFAFELTPQEVAVMRSQFVTSSRRNRLRPPIAYTEHGTIMLATVLNSPVAVAASVAVVRVFVRLREMAVTHKDLAAKLDELERKAKGHDEALKQVFQALRQIMAPPTRVIGFHVRHESKVPSEVPPTKAIQRK